MCPTICVSTARPNPSVEARPNSKTPGPRGGASLSSTSRAWRFAVGPASPQTLGLLGPAVSSLNTARRGGSASKLSSFQVASRRGRHDPFSKLGRREHGNPWPTLALPGIVGRLRAPTPLAHAPQSPRNGTSLRMGSLGGRPARCTSTGRPNHSVEARSNGGPPGPGHRYRVHFLWPGPGVPPLAPPHLKR